MFVPVAKPPVPRPPPSVKTLSEFGSRMGWCTGDSAAINRIRTLQREEIEAIGLTADLAARWREFYTAIKRAFPRNPSAAGRAALMHRAWRLCGS